MGDYATEFPSLSESSLNCQRVHTRKIDLTELVDMAQAQIRMHPEFNIREVWHLSDEEDTRERILTGSQTDRMHVSQRTKQRVSELFYDTTAADGNCTIRGCKTGSSSRRKIQEHSESHFLIYSVNCGYITSRRGSATKHIRKIHAKQGIVSQWDIYSWSEFRQQNNEDLPEEFPELPLNLKTIGNRCGRMTMMEADTDDDSKDQTDESAAVPSTSCCMTDPVRPIAIQPAVAVRRVDNSKASGQTVSSKENIDPVGVEPSPIVVVEQKLGLRRRLARDRQTLADLERMAREKKDDIARTLGQLASLGEKDPLQTDR